MKVTKEFTFHAAHIDREAPAGHQCGRLHGHTYKLELTVCGIVPKGGSMLIHGDILKEVYRAQIEPFVEHQYLNDTMNFNPTMENVARWCLQQLEKYISNNIETTKVMWSYKCSVRLWETPTMYANCP
jgi:6-pyruvoyltetrahydropterin/6-carboxytetrahydropterin synthase